MTPPKPAGFDREAIFDQWVWENLTRLLNIRGTSTVRVDHRSDGLFLHAAAESGAGSKLFLYRVTQLHDEDYVTARKWNPAAGDFSGGEEKVAKCIEARMPTGEIIDGLQISYSSYTDNLRLAESDAGASEWQVVHPRYVAHAEASETSPEVGSFMIVARVANGSGVLYQGANISLVELSPQRFWAYQSDQVGAGE